MWWATLTWLLVVVHLGYGNLDYLLSGDVTPSHYNLRLIYDIDPHTNFSFFGVVDILLAVKKTTPKIELHAQDFEITNDKITVTGESGSITVIEVKRKDIYNFLTIILEEELKENANYTLTICFFGNLAKELDGAYISSYIDKKTQQTEYLLTTQFEAISARKAFPCFDEPLYKAAFSLNVAHNKDYTAISNMPLVMSFKDNVMKEHWPSDTIAMIFKKDISNFVWDQFEKSMTMSTYLVAYVVSKFTYVESPKKHSHTKFRIWARSDAIDQTAYAAQVGPQVLSYFEEWFNVTFPLPKQDMIAIPDFVSGAMENWGLITYRESALLYDKKESSFLNKAGVVTTVAHELAHQWFGNLVTMKWWSDLWLNEGFATFMESVGASAVEPSWHERFNSIIESMLFILSFDALESSHPVSVQLDDPKRISEIFDGISYHKGASVIRMMLMILGEDIFRQALHNYLTKYSYSNAEQDDLWAELTDVVRQHGGLSRNVTVKEVMDTWTKQTGYPLLTVTRNYSKKSMTITQKRYLSLGTTRSTSSWWVPLRVLCEREVEAPKQEVQWLANSEGLTQRHKFEHGAAPSEWVLFNYDMIAPYRVNYDDQNWQLLISTLTSAKFTNVPMVGRVQLLSDAFALAWNNRLDYGTTLQLASYLQQETEYLPVSTGLSALGMIENIIKRSADYGTFQKFMRRLITKMYERAGGLYQKKIINPENLNSVKMQIKTSATACNMKVPGCEDNAIELFQRWMYTENPDQYNPIPVDLRSTVYCVALRRGSVGEWRFVLARHHNSNVAAARHNLLKALACSTDVWILTQYLDWTIIDGSEIRRQDSANVITAVVQSTIGYYIAKGFIYNRIEEIYNALKSHDQSIGTILTTLLAEFITERELDEFLAWQEKNTKYLSNSKLAVSQGIEKARVNIDWVNKNQKLVVEKLREFSVDFEDSLIKLRSFSKGNQMLMFDNMSLSVVFCLLLLLLIK